ncbi:MAG: hypothetical protein QOI03_1396 [Solirubrobacteraceae bacterium]|nr:hypothetical protein [Solirubrobacteraceae bacterium]
MFARVAESSAIGNNPGVQSALSTAVPAIAENGLNFVVFGTVAFSIVISLLFLVTRGSDSMYDHIGRGGISREGDYGGTPAPAPESAAGRAEREQEIRQMLGARSERLVRRGLPALDIDAELARLLSPPGEPEQPDAALREEVHQLVVARNERRVRHGLEPLDVDAEIQRTLAELAP